MQVSRSLQIIDNEARARDSRWLRGCGATKSMRRGLQLGAKYSAYACCACMTSSACHWKQRCRVAYGLLYVVRCVFVGKECLLLCGVSDDRCIGFSFVCWLFGGCMVGLLVVLFLPLLLSSFLAMPGLYRFLLVTQRCRSYIHCRWYQCRRFAAAVRQGPIVCKLHCCRGWRMSHCVIRKASGTCGFEYLRLKVTGRRTSLGNDMGTP